MRAGKKAVIFGACALLAAVFFFIAVVDAVVANGRAMQDASDVPDGFLTPVVIEGSISGGVVTMSVRGLGGDTAVRGADAVDAAVGAASRNSELDAGRLIIDAITGSVL
jgi:hypothetical protein